MITDKEFEAKVVFNYTASLRACPFCGGWKLRLSETEEGDNDANYVACESCWTTGPGAESPTKAIEAWNRRAEVKPPPKETQEAEYGKGK